MSGHKHLPALSSMPLALRICTSVAIWGQNFRSFEVLGLLFGQILVLKITDHLAR